MTCLSTRFHGLGLAPDQWHALVLATAGVVFLGLVATAWFKRREMVGTISVSALILVLFYLASPYSTDVARWWLGALIPPVALFWIYRFRHEIWKPVVVASAAWFAVAVLLLTSASANWFAFESFALKAIAFHLLDIVAWLAVRVVVPRTRGSEQAMRAVGLVVVVSLTLAALAWTAWREAVGRCRLVDAPIARSVSDIEGFVHDPWSRRRFGIFAVGTIEAPDGEGDASSFVATYLGQPQIEQDAARFPETFRLRMADGIVISVAGIDRLKQTFAWPETGEAIWEHGLRHGDPVVVWADLSEPTLGIADRSSPALIGTRLVAYGSLGDFQRDFLADLVRTSRLCGWIALVCLALALVPLGFGVRHYLRNRQS